MSLVDSLTLEKAQAALNRVKAEYETDKDYLAIILPDRYEETYDIMGNHFVPDEPLCQAFGLTWQKDFEGMVETNLKYNLSVCMVSNETNEMMGIRVINPMKVTDPKFDLSVLTDEPTRCCAEFLFHKEDELNFFGRYGIDEAIHFYALGVNKKYRRMGVGSRLLAAAVAMSRELGFKVIKGEGTSNFSQRIYEKQGFETILTMPYDSYMFKGRPIREGTGEHTMTKIYGLRL